MHPPFPCQKGMLVSAEGVTGVGKTYLTARLRADRQGPAAEAVIAEEFSRRPAHGELGHDLLHALTSAARGDPFLRGGRPAAETLLLLAIKPMTTKLIAHRPCAVAAWCSKAEACTASPSTSH